MRAHWLERHKWLTLLDPANWRTPRALALAAAIPLAATQISCGSDATGPGRVPTTIAILPASVTLDAIGATQSFDAEVRDQSGQVMQGASVSWSTETGSITTISGSGVATAENNGSARVVARFNTLQATADVHVQQQPYALVKLGGDNQHAGAGSQLVDPVRVSVRDRLNKPIQGVEVLFQASQGSGSVSAASATTNTAGEAATVWTIGTSTAAPHTISARAAGVPSTEVVFSATATAGSAVALVKSAGDGQTAVAGSAVASVPTVRATDAFGNPVSGVPVAFQVSAGGGSVQGGSAITNASGIASPLSWQLGTAVGENVLRAVASGLEPAEFTAQSVAGAPALMVVHQGNNQSASIATAVAVDPAVRVSDAFGNAVEGVVVTFAVSGGGGSVAGGNAVTNSGGIAAVASWTLGAAPGANELTASAPGITPTVFSATGTLIPANIVVHAGNGQNATVATNVAVSPAVRVTTAEGQPVQGVVVTFEITAGGGAVSGASASTNSNGVAAVESWTLGTIAGTNTLRASAPSLPAVVFNAQGIAGAAASIAINSGNNQIAQPGTAVNTPPSVLVRDAFANPVSGVAVAFAIEFGGGSTTGSVATTSAAGVAAVGSWTISQGLNFLSASAVGDGIGGNPVWFTATGVVSGGFNIELRFLPEGQSDLVPAQLAAFNNAVARWQSIIVGDIPAAGLNLNPGSCGANSPAMNEVIDDLVILVTLQYIDGPGGILGQAGPCWVRAGSLLPIVGLMQFDVSDLASIEANGLLESVILHEMGHVLGIGTLWAFAGMLINPSLPSSPGVDTHFSGPNSIAAFNSSGGDTYAGAKVPVENLQGSAGTRDAHWRESVFANELMTGFINLGSNPLSTVTIRSLQDLGYVVSTVPADPYVLPLAGLLAEPREGVRLVGDAIIDKIRIAPPR